MKTSRIGAVLVGLLLLAWGINTLFIFLFFFGLTAGSSESYPSLVLFSLVGIAQVVLGVAMVIGKLRLRKPKSRLGMTSAGIYLFIILASMVASPVLYVTFFPWTLLFPSLMNELVYAPTGPWYLLSPYNNWAPFLNIIGYYFLGKLIEKLWKKRKPNKGEG